MSEMTTDNTKLRERKHRLLLNTFLYRLRGNLESGDIVRAGNAADRLAREFRDGLPFLIAILERERGGEDMNGRGLVSMLMEVWVGTRRDRGADDRDLIAATGMDRAGWLQMVE